MTLPTDDPIEAVLFDFGGTLFDYDRLRPGLHDVLVKLSEAVGVTATNTQLAATYVAALRKSFAAHLDKRFYLMRELFRAAAVDTLEWLIAFRLVSTAGADPLEGLDDRRRPARVPLVEACDPFLAARPGDFWLTDGAVDTLRALRARGLRVGLVTNMDVDQLGHLIELAGLEPELDFTLTSEEARSCKPDRRIFIEATRQAGSTPGRTVYVGDSAAQDVAGARRAGLHPVLVARHGAPASPHDTAGPASAPAPTIGRLPDLLDLIEPTGRLGGHP
jgi:FMN phosphatase YigB (HAD superfamily)